MNTVKQRGFTLIEVLVSTVVLLLIIGAVLQLLNQSQERNSATATIEDATSMTRDSLDQMIMELRLAGYPPPNTYPSTTVMTTTQNYVATPGGFLCCTGGPNYHIQFEGDINNAGTVTVVDYQLQVPTGGNTGGCSDATIAVNANLTSPTLMRSAVAKNTDGSAVTPVYYPFLENVRNCTLSTPIFAYCTTAGGGSCPTMPNVTASTLTPPANTVAVGVRLQVQAAARDIRTGDMQNVELFGMAQRVNPDQ